MDQPILTIANETMAHHREIAANSDLILSERASSKAADALRALAIAICGATLVAAWRDGGAAKRTRL